MTDNIIATIAHLPHRLVTRRDARAVAGLLRTAGIDGSSPVGAELTDLLQRQIMDWRDFFTLRGGRMRRATLMVLTGRSIADDAVATARLDKLTSGRGNALLRTFSILIERLFDEGPWLPLAPAPKVVDRQPVQSQPNAPIPFEPRRRTATEAPHFADYRMAA